ncbi:MAG: hypothetical protein HKO93_00390, partial [Flavobacteriales bacterium]|nr:hypothetical protein [Flavobacteriales bacterium]
MNSFLKHVADRLLDGSLTMREQMVILPSRRSITYLKHILAKSIDRPIFLPRIVTMDQLASEISGMERLDPVSVGLELYATYSDLYKDAEEFEVFDSWSGAILKDFNTVDTYLIEAADLYTDLRHLKEINEWSFLEEELGADQQKYNNFWKRLGPLYIRFNERTELTGKTYSGAIMRKASDQMRTKRAFPNMKRILFAGFNALSNVEISILDRFHEEGRLEICWDDSRFFTSQSINPAGHFMRQWKQKEWIQSFSEDDDSTCEIEIASHPHAISQCMWAGSLLSDGEGEGDIAIVLADETLLGPLLDQFPSNIDHVNITIGLSFTHSQVYLFLKDYFLLHIRAEKAKNTGQIWQVHHEDLTRWAETSSRFHLIADHIVKSIDKKTKEGRQVFYNEEHLRELLGSEKVSRYGLFNVKMNNLINFSVQLLRDVRSSDRITVGIAERLIEIVTDTSEVISNYP